MNNEHQSTTKTALNQIENEIQQIDQLVHSWSSGKTLRFDPAHVRTPSEPAPQTPETKRPQKKSHPISFCFFAINLLAFLTPVTVLALPTLGLEIPTQIQNTILFAGLMLLAGGNLLLASIGSAIHQKNEPRKMTHPSTVEKHRTRSRSKRVG